MVGLLANSRTTSDYQCAYREGGGMAIAALAFGLYAARRAAKQEHAPSA